MAGRETTVKLSVADNFSTQLRAFARALDTSEQSVSKLSTSQQLLKTASEGATDMLMGMGVSLPTSPMMALGEAIKFSVDAAMEGEVAYAKTEAVIKSTGGAAGYTADEITKMAERYSDLSGVSHDVIQSAENVMLTFTAIGHDKFPQAMEAAQNLSAALGQDLQSSVIQVGKALQDPINGMTALRRVGVNFNDAAKETVKQMMDMGDVAGAQAFILKELNTEFGGMAEKMGDTTQGKINKTKDALDRLAETIGGPLITNLGKAADAATTLLTWNQKLADAFDGTEKKIAESSNSYDEYKSATEATARAAGLITDQFIVGQGYVTKYSDSFHMLTEAQFDATHGIYSMNGALDESNRITQKAIDAEKLLVQAQKALASGAYGVNGALDESNRAMLRSQEAAANLKDSETKVTRAMSDLKTVMGGELKNELSDFNSKQNELRVKADELQKTISTSYGKAKENAIASLGEVKNELLSNAAAHEDATHRIMFGYAEQQLAIGGLTEKESAALDALAVKWGLKSQEDIDAMNRVKASAELLAKDGSIDAFVQNVNGGMSAAEQAFQNAALAQQRMHDSVKPLAKQTDTTTFASTVNSDMNAAKLNFDAAAQAEQHLYDNTTPLAAQTNTTTFSLRVGTDMGNVVSSVQPAIGISEDLKRAIDNLHSKSITITTNYVETHTSKSSGATTPGAAQGANFIVPPDPNGGAGDYYPVRAAPGERVIVQTKEQQNTQNRAAQTTTGGGAATTNHIDNRTTHITINDPITGALAWKMLINSERQSSMRATM